jgi:hypothetical protein
MGGEGVNNRGSITVEACLVVPMFLFFMLAVSGISMMLLADAHIHQSLAEAAGYTAQYAYLEKQIMSESNALTQSIVNTTILKKQFKSYLGEDFYVEKMVQNGVTGILLTVIPDENNSKIFVAKADYVISMDIPLLGKWRIYRGNQVKQKAFVGYSKEEAAGEDVYVYVTPEQSVYHSKRSCTHLSLSISSISSWQKESYTPCSFCGKEKDSGKIYVTKTTNTYHCNKGCSGLKRTVKRVKKSELGGLQPCSRCGG